MAEENKEIKQPTGGNLSQEQKIEFKKEGIEAQEKKETLPEETIVREQLRREIDMMELDEGLKDESAQKAKKIQVLGEEEKIKHLLALAKSQGVIFAINTAKQMNDPYILDIFHDILVREGYYKQFLK